MADFLRVKEIATALAVDQTKVLEWIRSGELSAINVAERPHGRPRWRIPASAWRDFQSGRSNQATIAQPVAKRRRRAADSNIIEFY